MRLSRLKTGKKQPHKLKQRPPNMQSQTDVNIIRQTELSYPKLDSPHTILKTIKPKLRLTCRQYRNTNNLYSFHQNPKNGTFKP